MENKKKKLEIINMSSNFSHFRNVLIFWIYIYDGQIW